VDDDLSLVATVAADTREKDHRAIDLKFTPKNFKMLANLHGGMAGGLSKVAAAGSGSSGIPFAVEGTTSDPKIVPEVGGVAGNVATGAAKGVAGGATGYATVPAKAVGRLFGDKR
jgi:hypothetical protein